MRGIGWMVVLLLVAGTGFAQVRKQVGQVNGQAVYADQIAGRDPQGKAESARDLFMRPVIRTWVKQHFEQFKLTPKESGELAERIREYAACSHNGYTLPEDPTARTIVLQGLGGNIRLQKALYDGFGGGRLLFQQGGIEAYDATRKFLEQKEAAGAISFSDPQVRALAYDYWTNDRSGIFLSGPEQVSRALDVRSVIATCPGD